MSSESAALDEALATFEEAAIRWAGTAFGQPLVDAAAAALVAGLDTPTLRVLAGAPARLADEEASDYAAEVFDELGLAIPEKLTSDAFVALGKLEAKRFLASGGSARRLAGDISVLHGLSDYRSELNDIAVLAEWYTIIELELVDGDISAVDEEVRLGAERLVAGLASEGRRVGDPYMATIPNDEKPFGERLKRWLGFKGDSK